MPTPFEAVGIVRNREWLVFRSACVQERRAEAGHCAHIARGPKPFGEAPGVELESLEQSRVTEKVQQRPRCQAGGPFERTRIAQRLVYELCRCEECWGLPGSFGVSDPAFGVLVEQFTRRADGVR